MTPTWGSRKVGWNGLPGGRHRPFRGQTMRWFAWAVGQLLRPRQLTMEQIRNGETIRWGWRATEVLDDDGKVIAYTPGANKP